jgi:hypothetical protein
MPYNADGSKTKNPTRGQRAQYNRQKAQARAMRPKTKTSASNQGGASIGGGTSGGGGG